MADDRTKEGGSGLPRGEEALVTPEVLTWARNEAGYTLEAIAHKARVSPSSLDLWERGAARPTMKALERLAEGYHVPLCIFYLPSPPAEAEAHPEDYRYGLDSERQDPEISLEVRRAKRLITQATDLAAPLEYKPRSLSLSLDVSESYEETARRVLDYFGLNGLNRSSQDPADWYRMYRSKVEAADILVLQMTSGIPASSVRGFSVYAPAFSAVVINQKDAYSGRCFTLWHEVIHLVLHQSGVCLPSIDPDIARDHTIPRIETFCNRVAAEILLPAGWIRAFLADQDHRPMDLALLTSLSRLTGASREAIAIRLRSLEVISWPTADALLDAIYDSYQTARPKKGHPRREQLALSRIGRRFAALVFEAIQRDEISTAEAVRYLDRIPRNKLPALRTLLDRDLESI